MHRADMHRADMERAIRHAYAERLTNDVDRVCALFWDDALIRIAGKTDATDFVTGGQSSVSVRPVVEALVHNWHWLEIRFFNLLIDGNRAAVHYTARLRLTPTREIQETELFDFVTFRDGKVAELVEFCDTAVIAGLMTSAGKR